MIAAVSGLRRVVASSLDMDSMSSPRIDRHLGISARRVCHHARAPRRPPRRSAGVAPRAWRRSVLAATKAGKFYDDAKKGQVDETLEAMLFAAANTE